MSVPEISVIIPSYNRASFLRNTVESVLAQSLPVKEVLIVDDGSTDETRTVIEKIVSTIPGGHKTLRYLRQDNKGKSVALNKALSEATGAWIAFNDSDDTWHSDKLACQFEAFSRFPGCSACFTDAQFVNNPAMERTAFQSASKTYSEEFGIVEDPVSFMLDLPHGVYMQTVIVRKEVMDRIGEFDPLLLVSQDRDFLFRLAKETSLCFVNKPLVFIDRTADRAIGLVTQFKGGSLKRLEAQRYSCEKWMRASMNDLVLRQRLKELLAGIESELSDALVLKGQTAEARERLKHSVLLKPTFNRIAKLLLVSAAPGIQRKLLARRIQPDRISV